MPKLTPARLDGVYGMEKFTAEELQVKADAYEEHIIDPNNIDDPKWLQRWADHIRKLAEQKEKSSKMKSSTLKSPNNHMQSWHLGMWAT